MAKFVAALFVPTRELIEARAGRRKQHNLALPGDRCGRRNRRFEALAMAVFDEPVKGCCEQLSVFADQEGSPDARCRGLGEGEEILPLCLPSGDQQNWLLEGGKSGDRGCHICRL